MIGGATPAPGSSDVRLAHSDRSRALTPPLDVVRAVIEAFTGRGVDVALGGSALLAAGGLVERIGDWDLTTDAGPVLVEEVLAELALPWTRAARAHPFLTEACFTVDAGDHTVDVLSRFAVATSDGVLEVPTRTTGTWLGMPLGDSRAWVRAYRAMGREDRADALAAGLEHDR